MPKAIKTALNEFVLYPSNIKGKRYTVYVPKGNRLIKIDFGSSEHENYSIHKDPDRKRLYRIRHKNDHINDPYSAGFWAYHVLWNKPSLQESMKDAVSLSNKLIRG